MGFTGGGCFSSTFRFNPCTDFAPSEIIFAAVRAGTNFFLQFPLVLFPQNCICMKIQEEYSENVILIDVHRFLVVFIDLHGFLCFLLFCLSITHPVLQNWKAPTRGGYFFSWAIRGSSTRKGWYFHAGSMWKGRDFTIEVYERVGVSVGKASKRGST